MVSSVETSLFRPSIYLVWVLGALEALQCIICHYLWTELWTVKQMEQIRRFIIIDEASSTKEKSVCLLRPPLWFGQFEFLILAI